LCCACCRKKKRGGGYDDDEAGGGMLNKQQEDLYLAKKAIHRSHVLMGCEYEGEEETVTKVFAYLRGVAKVELDGADLDMLIRHERRKHIYYFHHQGGGKDSGDGGAAD
jgi:hypothetical protein